MNKRSNKSYIDSSIEAAIVEHIEQGLLIINQSYQIVFANNWLKIRCHALQQQENNFFKLFPELKQGRVADAITVALTQNMSSLISHLFIRSPFPIFQLTSHSSTSHILSNKRISQSVQLVPIENTKTHEKQCLINISDITSAVQREDALKQQMTVRRKAEQALEQEQKLFVAGPSVIFKLEYYVDFSITYVSPNVSLQFAYDAKDLVNGKSFLELIFPADKAEYLEEMELAIAKNLEYFERVYRIFDAKGNIRWVHDYMTLIYDSLDNVKYLYGYLNDISKQKKAEQLIKQQAYYDALTDLPNRRMLMDRLERTLIRSKRKNYYVALAYLDLDKFKYINDSLGHNIGDELLIEVARRLKKEIRADDMAVRMGGDEFVILLPDIGNEKSLAAERSGNILENVRKSLSSVYVINSHELHTSPSIGVAIFKGGEGINEEMVIQQADTAMYRAKEEGRNTIRFYTQSMQKVANNRIEIEKNLRLAVTNDELRLLFQPQISHQGNLVACEALVRWEKKNKIISPIDFIPIAEETGIIIDIGEWVLHESCRNFKQWQANMSSDSNYKMKHIAVNVSPRQFRDKNFISLVQHVLNEYDMKSSELEVEITESIVIDNVEDTIKKMCQLKDMGVRLAMDDFGTGYSSLSYLKKLPLDILKIDQSFIRDANFNSNDKAIISTIIAMAQKLDMVTVAEGIEDEEILKFLKSEGCLIYQGYYFSKPISGDIFLNFLKNWKEFDN